MNDNQIENLIKDNSIEIFKELQCANKDSYQKIIEELCIKDKIDYFDLASQALNKNANSYNLGNVLVDFIPYSKINIDSIFALYEKLYSKDDGTSIHFNITKTLVKNNHDLAKKLLERLLKKSELFIIPHVSSILIELHNSHNDNQYDTVISFFKKDTILELKIVIGYIHLFNFSDNELKNIFELFEEKVQLSNKEIDRELIYNSYDLIEKSYEYFSEIILLYIGKEDIDIKSHIAKVLNYASKNHIKKDWFKKSFLSIIDINIEQQNILYNIEFILNTYLEKDDYDFIKKFLYKWVEKGNLSSLYTKTTLDIFSRDFNKYKRFSQFITETLVYENDKLHQILPKLILEKELKLDVKILENLDIDDYLYLCRKILGYFYEFEIINSMIFSILSVEKLPIEVKRIVIDILINYIGKEYQQNTLEFLEKLDNSTLNKNEKEAKKIVISKLIEKKGKRKNLPKLKELLPSQQQNRIISRVQGVAMQKAMAQSEKDSFSSTLYGNEIIIRYGKGWFSEFQGNFTEISYMESYSYTITMPSSIQSQPIQYELESYNFKIAKKGL